MERIMCEGSCAAKNKVNQKTTEAEIRLRCPMLCETPASVMHTKL